MKLSIITINFNNTTGLRKTVESVVSQTSQNFEYIIIDGGSSDGSLEVIMKFAGNIDHWVSEPDNGIYHAMNKGILLAKGEYCQFLNSGDCLVSPDTTDKMLANISDQGILIGNMLKLHQNGKILRDKGTSFEKPTVLTFYRGTLNHSTAYIKRVLFNKYGLYDESLKIVSDWKWYFIVIGLNNEKVKYVNIDVSLFDMTGISNFRHDIENEERRQVLEELLPVNVLADYDAYWRLIDQALRINRYKITRYFFWLIERFLFKLQKSKVF
ncbi:MAG TPA: glycosyltransferase family 2 protein [Prolixibacteraceae bacterium]|nr:glycosyltransferase family 2 protein [Prolixibacteraceae bacterium]HOG96609.1 glycosyltransferase family 2 protein [Prolixibacteraceae bacterium]HQB27332.1 glycosyltransferase family 2 protein [Paludibacter sp.]